MKEEGGVRHEHIKKKQDIFYEHFNLFMNSGVSTNVTTLGNDTMSIILRKKDCIKTYKPFFCPYTIQKGGGEKDCRFEQTQRKIEVLP